MQLPTPANIEGGQFEIEKTFLQVGFLDLIARLEKADVACRRPRGSSVPGAANAIANADRLDPLTAALAGQRGERNLRTSEVDNQNLK